MTVRSGDTDAHTNPKQQLQGLSWEEAAIVIAEQRLSVDVRREDMNISAFDDAHLSPLSSYIDTHGRMTSELEADVQRALLARSTTMHVYVSLLTCP